MRPWLDFFFRHAPTTEFYTLSLHDALPILLVSTHLMDEAERCHRLAILDQGRLVADGTPAELEAALAGRTLLVQAREPRRAQQQIAGIEGVLSVAQVGNALRVLVGKGSEAPDRIRDRLAGFDRDARVEAVDPNLEDVFVSATIAGSGQARRAA